MTALILRDLQISASDNDDDEDIIGPVPAKGLAQSTVAEDFERRAWKMKQKLTSNDDAPKNPARESWMTELPPELSNFGLGPRTFKRRTNERSGDRSDWTDTPADKERKAREKQEGKVSSSKGEEIPQVSERDKRLAEQVSTYNDSKRSESLIDLHRKKLKRKADTDKDKPKERRAFDREQDLQVNRFDDAQKKALLRKSKELNTKFSHGNSSMFL
ncbi:GPALPP motifs-containing protein 1 isoform X2 [Dendrobates tinctorius]|uniref:GPALPP motifs-containing protein 1 isoform X2 n=1 Tax=Dendrobates tinctorius TaxID=92724 RepID=UPI003CC95A9A